MNFCDEIEGTSLSNFDSVGDCVDSAFENLLRNELIILNFKFVIQLHFMHVIWTNLKNSDLPLSEGGCMPIEVNRNIQM